VGRNVLWLIAWPYLLLLFILTTWSRPVGISLLVLSCIGAVILIVRSRTGERASRFSTNCEECHAQLPMRFGLATSICQSCGHVQSWSNK
jgi:Na+/H+ antiporter NhaD/arsenite permease-like protein